MGNSLQWLANFYDVMIPGEANEDYAEFVRQKIRERVKDPVVAEKLVPRDHMFGSKRLPCESGYYEVYNQDNVLLVDVRETPIERITPTGVKTRDAEYELDVLIFATGYDAVQPVGSETTPIRFSTRRSYVAPAGMSPQLLIQA